MTRGVSQSCWSKWQQTPQGPDKTQVHEDNNHMMYVVAIFLPPLAVLLCGKPFQALFNLCLCGFFWIPAVVHAFVVIGGQNADRRTDRIVDAIRQGKR